MPRVSSPRALHALGCAAALVGIAVLGCAPTSPRGRVRTSTGDLRETTLNDLQRAALGRAARELRCPSAELAIESLGAGGYRVDGCSQTITYTCARGAEIVCSPSERTGTATELRAEWSDEDVQRYSAAVHDRAAACLPPETEEARIEVAFTREGIVRRTGRTPRDAATAACVDAVLASETLHATATADRYAVLEIRRSDIGRVAPPAPPVEAAPTAPAPTRAAIRPDAAARAVVDARAAEILGCVEARAISVQLSWDRSGALDALLRGEGHRASDEPCVRAIVRGLRIPAPGSAGTIAHTLQR